MRAPVGFCSLLALSALAGSLASGCSERPPAPTAPFEAGTAEEALARVRAFLDAYVAADVDKALSHLCERDPRTRAFLERSLAPGSPFRVESYEIQSATPLWERKQPLHLVLVEIRGRSGSPVEHGYRVRAEDGCIERLFGAASMGPSPHGRSSPQVSPHGSSPHGAPPSSPHGAPRASPHAGPPAPSERPLAPRDVEERDDGSWGPSLPAAPTKPDAEIIDL